MAIKEKFSFLLAVVGVKPRVPCMLESILTSECYLSMEMPALFMMITR